MEDLKEVVAALVGEGVNLDDMDPTDPVAINSRRIERVFTRGVEVLRDNYAGTPLGDLLSDIWSVFHHQLAVVAVGPDVPSLSFGLFQRDGIRRAMVLVPPSWVGMFEADPLLQLGAIIFVGSQAVDCYNGRINSDGPDGIMRRARAWEAVYVKRACPDSTSPWHVRILREFPEGPGAGMLYTRLPVMPPN